MTKRSTPSFGSQDSCVCQVDLFMAERGAKFRRKTDWVRPRFWEIMTLFSAWWKPVLLCFCHMKCGIPGAWLIGPAPGCVMPHVFFHGQRPGSSVFSPHPMRASSGSCVHALGKVAKRRILRCPSSSVFTNSRVTVKIIHYDHYSCFDLTSLIQLLLQETMGIADFDRRRGREWKPRDGKKKRRFASAITCYPPLGAGMMN